MNKPIPQTPLIKRMEHLFVASSYAADSVFTQIDNNFCSLDETDPVLSDVAMRIGQID